MLVNGWKRIIEKRGRSQSSTAKALSVNQSEMSMVMQGRAFLTPEKFRQACELLNVRPRELYTPDALALLYGITTEEPAQKKRRVRVELDLDNLDRVDSLADDEKLSRSQAVNAIIRRAYETRRIEVQYGNGD